jgi:hypothetical protein
MCQEFRLVPLVLGDFAMNGKNLVKMAVAALTVVGVLSGRSSTAETRL